MRYAFEKPHTEVVSFARDGETLRATGSGRVRITTGGGTFTADVPFTRHLAAAASTHTFSVPSLLRAQIQRAKRRAGLRVLVPSRLTTEFSRLYPGSSVRRNHYALDLGAVRGCHEATACFVAAFLGDRTRAAAVGDTRVRLAKGRRGWFTRTHCGASCAAPQVQWRERGVLYTLQVKGAGPDGERALLVALANSAIRAGAR